MYCTNCGKEVNAQAVACMSCGLHPRTKNNFCYNCGNSVHPEAVVCVNCGSQLGHNSQGQKPYAPQGQQAYTGTIPGEGKAWLTTLLLCIFLGGLGIHRFYTGHTTIGIIQILTGGGCGIWALIDLIQIITGSYRDAQGNPLLKSN